VAKRLGSAEFRGSSVVTEPIVRPWLTSWARAGRAGRNRSVRAAADLDHYAVTARETLDASPVVIADRRL
jgi:hypothetical protein